LSANVRPAPSDGRTARSQRTHAAIVDAHVALLQSGNLRPTGEQVAARAGTSVRSLWIHFPEQEALLEATAEAVLARQDRAFRPVDPSLGLPERVDAFCQQRAAMLEAIAPFARASALREPFSPALRDYRRRHIQRVLDEVRALFRPELSLVPEHARSDLVCAIAVATTWGSWATLRDDLGLDRARAGAAMALGVSSLLSAIDPTTPEKKPKEQQ